jgi:hypothetical protein
MVIVLACGALIASRYLPLIIPEETANRLIYQGLLIAAYALIGVIVLYALGVLLLLIAHGRELMDKRQFEEPVALVARSAENAKKYEREEGGNNRFQNHLASLTLVKPGFVRGIALREHAVPDQSLVPLLVQYRHAWRYPDHPLGPLDSH